MPTNNVPIIIFFFHHKRWDKNTYFQYLSPSVSTKACQCASSLTWFPNRLVDMLASTLCRQTDTLKFVLSSQTFKSSIIQFSSTVTNLLFRGLNLTETINVTLTNINKLNIRKKVGSCHRILRKITSNVLIFASATCYYNPCLQLTSSSPAFKVPMCPLWSSGRYVGSALHGSQTEILSLLPPSAFPLRLSERVPLCLTLVLFL